MTTNKEYKARARQSLKGNWIFLYFVLLLGSVNAFLPDNTAWYIRGSVFIFAAAVSAVADILCLWISEGKKLDINDVTQYFPKVAKLLLLTFRMNIIIFLYTLFFIIPGIMKSYSYAMAYFVFKEEPELPIGAIIKKSKDLMHGNKAGLFHLDLSFILWYILALIIVSVISIFLALNSNQISEPLNFEQGLVYSSWEIAANYIIGIITGLYFVFVSIYVNVSHAHFYLELTKTGESDETFYQYNSDKLNDASYSATMESSIPYETQENNYEEN